MKISLLITKIIIIIGLCAFLNSCGSFKMTDAKEVSPNPDERVKKNMEEGKGLRLSNLNKQSGNFQFASSNPLWRASLDVLDFAPLLSANYSGGIIITDWIETDTQNEFFKITIKFLSNEIRPDGLDIGIHQKICSEKNICNTNKLETKISNELKIKILKTAAQYEKNDLAKFKEENGEYRVVPVK